jgi:hypothetical protein
VAQARSTYPGIWNSSYSSVLAQVITCETSRDLWQSLQHIFDSKSLARILELSLQLQTTKKGNLSLLEYLPKIRSIADRRRSIGAEVSEQDFLLYVLSGLGGETEAFVTALTTRNTPLTMADLHGP